MVRTTDGFELADEDLRLRGEGTLFDTKQSGMPDLRLARLADDLDLVRRARLRAFTHRRRGPPIGPAPRTARRAPHAVRALDRLALQLIASGARRLTRDMRIVAGSAKGVRLAPVPDGVRPLSDRAREGLFSSLGTAVDGRERPGSLRRDGRHGDRGAVAGCRQGRVRRSFPARDRRRARQPRARPSCRGRNRRGVRGRDVPEGRASVARPVRPRVLRSAVRGRRPRTWRASCKSSTRGGSRPRVGRSCSAGVPRVPRLSFRYTGALRGNCATATVS